MSTGNPIAESFVSQIPDTGDAKPERRQLRPIDLEKDLEALSTPKIADDTQALQVTNNIRLSLVEQAMANLDPGRSMTYSVIDQLLSSHDSQLLKIRELRQNADGVGALSDMTDLIGDFLMQLPVEAKLPGVDVTGTLGGTSEGKTLESSSIPPVDVVPGQTGIGIESLDPDTFIS